MEKGFIAIFREKTKSGRYSVSVRQVQTKEQLESQFKNEHKNTDIELVKAFSFECENCITDIETTLRKLLIKGFGKYTPKNNWECYLCSELNGNDIDFVCFIDNLVKMISEISKIKNI